MEKEGCSDNRFDIIEQAKKAIIASTNIESSPDEMKVLDSILFRCWQMGWLENYGNTLGIMMIRLPNMAPGKKVLLSLMIEEIISPIYIHLTESGT